MLPFGVSPAAMQNSLQEALDDLLSSHSSMDSQNDALEVLDHVIAVSCGRRESTDYMTTFLALQDTFECNIPARLLTWIASSIPRLELLASRGPLDHNREAETLALSAQLSLSLFLVQGVVLHHEASKRYTGRKYALEILIDLLLASRHLSSIPLKNATSSSSKSSRTQTGVTATLSSVVLETLLCILVDSPPALRAFEESNGLQAVVKILKRPGTPREDKMKCLEFIYFYLLDEASPSPPDPPTAPSTPPRTSNSYPNESSSTAVSSSSTSRASSWGSLSSFSSSTYSTTTATTCNTSPSTSPSPSPSLLATRELSCFTNPVHSRPLLMLHKEVNYVPLSPKKPHATLFGVGSCRQSTSTDGGVEPLVRKGSSETSRGEPDDLSYGRERRGKESLDRDRVGRAIIDKNGGRGRQRSMERPRIRVRTTGEKKEILGGMLDNVDALVEDIRKAGIWGLT